MIYYTEGFGAEFFATEEEARVTFKGLPREYGDLDFGDIFEEAEFDIDALTITTASHSLKCGSAATFWGDTSDETKRAMIAEAESR